MATASPALPGALSVDPLLVDAIVSAVESCLSMCDARARCVGVTTVPVRDPGSITGIIGVHGDVSGFVTVNMAEDVARALVGGLLQDRFDALSPQVVDGAGEITNIIAGGVKKGVLGTPWGFSHVTVPSVIIGNNYQITYTKGLHYAAVTFEHENDRTLLLDQRLLHVAISLLRL
ncbi:MAG: chemotaxis protein CheX [Planctomycetota bacterium]